jgi:hypothetical protein
LADAKTAEDSPPILSIAASLRQECIGDGREIELF